VECRYLESIDRKRKRTTNKVYGSTGSSILPVEVRQQDEKLQQGRPSNANERKALHDSGEETFGDWSLDIDNPLDPMLSPQLGSLDKARDMASDMSWDTFLEGDHSSLGQ
jgi:hypothetical protein